MIVSNPKIRSGQPCVKGVPCEIIAGRHTAGDTVAALADDYRMSEAEIEEAIAFWQRWCAAGIAERMRMKREIAED